MPLPQMIRRNASPLSMPTQSNYSELHRQGIAALKAVQNDMAALDARLLLCLAVGISHEKLVADGDVIATESEAAQFNALIKRRAAGEPISRILGTREFWGLEFQLGPETLIPRPDSEAIVSKVLDLVKDRQAPLRILDLGTGSGCLLLALIYEFPTATGIGIDVSEAALGVATRNADHLGLAARVDFQQGHWGQDLTQEFDIVVSNPPYIPTAEVGQLSVEVRDFDPARALDGGEDGMVCYRDILKQLPDLLCQHGIAAFETSPDLYTELRELVDCQGQFDQIEAIKDIADRYRGLSFRKRDFAR